jgi:hypothetical protein
MRRRSLYIAVLFCLSTVATADTVHRWQDANGVVNYGDTPPAGVRSTPIQTADPLKISKQPALDSGAPTTPAAPQNLDRSAIRTEIEQALQQQSANAAAEARRQDDAARLAAKRRCESERRVDCDDPPWTDTSPWADTYFDRPPMVVRRHPGWTHSPYPPGHRPGYPPAPPSNHTPPRPVERPALMRKLP